MLKFRQGLLAALVAATLGGASYADVARADVEVFFNIAPPTSRVEVIPHPRHGYIWAPGYWDSHRGKHKWKKGHWERERHQQVYRQPRWIERNNGWALERGRWDPRDRDGDGVPNNRDHRPDNPHRR